MRESIPIHLIRASGHGDQNRILAWMHYLDQHREVPPLRVRRIPGGQYMLLEGLHRWRAAKALGVPEISAWVEEP